MVDPEQAAELIETLQGVQPDELAILVVGPADASAPPNAIPVSFPAQAGDPPSKLLIAGQLCNLVVNPSLPSIPSTQMLSYRKLPAVSLSCIGTSGRRTNG